MSEQLSLAVETPQLTWTPPKTRNACTRDPAAGPGSCWYWWEGCPKAADRGCYRGWATSDALLAHWAGAAPDDWTSAPDALAPVTAGRLKDQGRIEIHQPEGERWQWRRFRPSPKAPA